MNRESSWSVIVAFIIVTVAIGIGALLLLSSRPQPVEIVINPPIPTRTPEATLTPAPILIYVTGAVANPQTTIALPAGSRVQDAITAAGGILPQADMEQVNVAGIVRDGDHIHVYAIGETQPAALPTSSGGGIIYINTATLEELQGLPGVGPVLAQRIIDHRNQNGRFTDLASLDAVNGIGPAILENIASMISFE